MRSPILPVISLIPLGFERTFALLSQHIYRFRGILFAATASKRADRRPNAHFYDLVLVA
jgi:hypothetical protein